MTEAPTPYVLDADTMTGGMRPIRQAVLAIGSNLGDRIDKLQGGSYSQHRTDGDKQIAQDRGATGPQFPPSMTQRGPGHDGKDHGSHGAGGKGVDGGGARQWRPEQHGSKQRQPNWEPGIADVQDENAWIGGRTPTSPAD